MLFSSLFGEMIQFDEHIFSNGLKPPLRDPWDERYIYLHEWLIFMVGKIYRSSHGSGQIIATSHDRKPPKRWFRKGNLLISGKSRLVKYYNLTRWIRSGL